MLLKFGRTGNVLDQFDAKCGRRYHGDKGEGNGRGCQSFFDLYMRRRSDERFVCGGGVDEAKIVSGDGAGSVFGSWVSVLRPQVREGLIGVSFTIIFTSAA